MKIDEFLDIELEKLKTEMLEQGYLYLTIINNQLCGIMPFFTTYGLVINLNKIGYERRYCYQHKSEALQALKLYTDTKEHPEGNWIKCKGRFNGRPIDLFNPKFVEEP